MNEFDGIRKELDELRERVALVESQGTLSKGDMAGAQLLARQADRRVSDYQVEIREGFAKIDADLARISGLLRVALNAPTET